MHLFTATGDGATKKKKTKIVKRIVKRKKKKDRPLDRQKKRPLSPVRKRSPPQFSRHRQRSPLRWAIFWSILFLPKSHLPEKCHSLKKNLWSHSLLLTCKHSIFVTTFIPTLFVLLFKLWDLNVDGFQTILENRRSFKWICYGYQTFVR